MAYPNFLDRVKQLVGGVPQGLNQIGQSLQQSQQSFSKRPLVGGLVGQAFQSKPVQNFVQQATRQVAQQPIYNVPNAPTYKQMGNLAKNYATNRVIKPIVQASFDYNNPKSTNLQKGMAFAQAGMGVFNATPGGLGYNAVVQGGAGALEAFRNKTNLSKGYAKGLTNQTSLGSQGLGIKNPILAGGVDFIAGLKSFDPYRAGGLGVAALEKTLAPKGNILHADDIKEIVNMTKRMTSRWMKGNHIDLDQFGKDDALANTILTSKYGATAKELKAMTLPDKVKTLERIAAEDFRQNPSIKLQDAQSSIKLPKQLPKELNSLNPTGNVLAKYGAKERATLPLGKNIVSLAETSSKSPDEMITIYRGVKDNHGNINAGDFITTNPQLARDYAGNGKVLSKKVRLGDILDDVSEPLGEEYIYRPQSTSSLPKELEGLANDTIKLYKGTGGELDMGGATGLNYVNKAIEARKGHPTGARSYSTSWNQASDYGNVKEFTVKKSDIMPASEYEKLVLSIDERIVNPASWRSEKYGKQIVDAIKAKGYKGFEASFDLWKRPEVVLLDNNAAKIVNQSKGVQNADLSFKLPKPRPQTKQPTLLLGSRQRGSQQPPTGVPPSSKGFSSGTSVPQKPRGFTISVKEAPNVRPKVKGSVNKTYIPKPNEKLMGEAEGLLHEGVKLNLTNVKDVDRKVAATIQQAINSQRKNPEQAANLFNNLSEQGTELGRGVQAFSLLKQMTPEAIALSAAGKIKKYNMTATRKIPELTGEQVELIAKRVDALNKLKVGSREHNIAVNELSNVINEFIPSSLVDKAVTVWKAGLLTSLRTHERNLLGNTIMGSAEVVKDVFASPLDMLMSMKTGKRTLTLNVKGQGAGMKKGIVAAKDIVQKGYDPEQTIAKFDQRRITWGNNPLEQALKKGTDVVFRSLGGEDKPFLHGATARSLFDQAKTEAINVGRKGDTKLIEKLVANPTEEMIKIAQIDANYATFHDKTMLGTIANGIKRVASDSTYGKWGRFGQAVTEILAPFTGVPSSIVGKTIDYSPIGLAKGTVNVGRVLTGHIPELQRQAAQEMGRGILGTGIFGLGAYLMSKGLMTGQPKDSKESDQWQIEGKQANSVLINGKWRSINSIGPQNLVMLAGAKWREEKDKVDGSMSDYAAALAKDQLSQTFLQGVQGPLNAISDPKRFAKSYIGNQIASVIPNIVKDVAKSQDGTQRESNSIQDYVKNSIPLLRNQSTPKRDVLGNAMPQEPTGVGAFVDLFNSKTPIKNSVTNELSRLNNSGNNAVPSKLSKTQTIQGEKTTLTPEQLDSLEKFRGPILSQALDRLFQSPSYQSKDDQDKALAVDSVVKKVNKYMRGEGGAPTFNEGDKSKTPSIDLEVKSKDKKSTIKKAKTIKVKMGRAKKPKKGKKISIAKLKVGSVKRINIKMKVPKMPKIKKMKKPQLTFSKKRSTIRVKV